VRSWGVRRAGIGEPRPRPTRYGLSAKELEVAQAVADGLTNREIGSRLYISHHTVDTHLRNIFGKTGVNSRAALARLLASGDDPVPT
jgi:DNA-binding CsgD family transcriptional regulator